MAWFVHGMVVRPRTIFADVATQISLPKEAAGETVHLGLFTTTLKH